MDIDLISSIIFLAIRAGTPLLLVALGELVCEKSGVLNLGQEGMMLLGAVLGFVIAYESGSAFFGLIAAAITGIFASLLFAVIVLQFFANQVAAGLALTIFGFGLSSFVGAGYIGKAVDGIPSWNFFGLSEIPFLGNVLFSHDPIVYLALIVCPILYWFVYGTHAGLVLRAVGESPETASRMGINVLTVRYCSIMFGGAMAGLGGAYLSLVVTPLWADGMTAGRGWIALALVVFASWRIGRLVFGAFLFGLMGILNLVLQSIGVSTSPNLLASLPYVVTIVALIILSKNRRGSMLYIPLSLGKPFHFLN